MTELEFDDEIDPADVEDEFVEEYEIEDPLAEFFEQARTADRSWIKKSECLGLPTELWFPDSGTEDKATGKLDPQSYYDFARFVCEQCPVREQCRDYAIENNETEGMWGAFTPEQRLNFKFGRTAVCGMCETTFTPGRGKFCSLKCRVEAEQERHAARRRLALVK